MEIWRALCESSLPRMAGNATYRTHDEFVTKKNDGHAAIAARIDIIITDNIRSLFPSIG